MLGPEDDEYDTLDDFERTRKKIDVDDFSQTPYPDASGDVLVDSTATDEEKLSQAWINERCAPALLAFQDDLVANLVEALEVQVGLQ